MNITEREAAYLRRQNDHSGEPPRYGKYKAKSLWFCIRCTEEVEPNPEHSPKGHRKPSKCERCGDIAQFFPSQREYRRYRALRVLEAYGDIKDLELQPRYPMIVNQIKVGEYRADFRYIEKDGSVVVEDTKGVVTQIYALKKKIVEAQYGFKIKET